MATEKSTNAVSTMNSEPSAYGALLRDKTVIVEIGAQHAQYSVHPGLLAHHSEYFKRALDGSWKESEERIVKLVDVDCVVFELFLEWLYTQQYPKDHRFGHPGQNRQKQLHRLKACVSGDRFLCPTFRTASEAALTESMLARNRAPFYTTIMYAYKHLPSDSPVLPALVDQYCYRFCAQSDTDRNGELARRSELRHEFLLKVMLRYMELQPSNHKMRKRPSPCDYHKHSAEDERGDKCKVQRVDDFPKTLP